MQTRVTDFLLYKWRYLLGYGFLTALVGSVLFIASSYVPGELRQAEMEAAVQSATLSLKSLAPDMVINLPYHALQRLIFETFGVSTMTIKLPSVILSVLSLIGLTLLIRTWFRRNIAIIAGVIAATTVHFLFISQDGTPLIMYTFLSSWLLFFATYVTRQKNFSTLWKVLACVFIAALLYTPLGLYLVLAIATVIIFHPHVRFIVKRFSTVKLLLAIVIGVVTLLPLFYASYIDPQVAQTLLGIPPHLGDIPANIQRTILDLFGFFAQTNSAIVRPLYSLPLVILVGIGIFKLVTYKYTARSYIVSVWGVFLFPIVLINRDMGVYLFPIAMLLMALGIAMLITNWYKLFPRNPYARVVGLIPLGILVIGLVSSGVLRYINNYQYNGQILTHYSKDLWLLQNQVTPQRPGGPTQLIVSPQEMAFYGTVAHYDKRFSVTTTQPTTSTEKIYTRAAKKAFAPKQEPSQILTSSRAMDADRFYIYKSAAK